VARSFPYIYYGLSEHFFKNENRDNCRQVSLKLETVVFDKKSGGSEAP